MRRDLALEQGVQAFVGHHILAKLDVGISLVELASRGRVFELAARNQPRRDPLALSNDPAILRGRPVPLQIDPYMTAEVKAIKIARGGQESRVEQVRRCFAPLRE